MNRGKISNTQLTAIVWCATLAPLTQLLPSITVRTAGRAAWLAPVAAIPLVAAGIWARNRLSGEKGLAAGIREACGTTLGTAVLLVYLLWAQVMLTVALRSSAQRLISTGTRDGSLEFFLLGIAGLSLWISTSPLPSFARAGQIFLAALLTAGVFLLVLALPRAEPERVLPIWVQDVKPVLLSALPAAGVLASGLYGAFLCGDTAEGKGWSVVWGLGGCLLAALEQMILLGCYGAKLTARLEDPFFSLAKSVGIEGAFQRIESLIAGIWTFSDLTLICLLLFAVQKIAEELVPLRNRKWAAVVSLLLGVCGAEYLVTAESALVWSQKYLPAGNLILAGILPGMLGACGGKRNRDRDKDRSKEPGEE